MNAFIRKAAGAAVSLSMIATAFGPMVAPMAHAAAGNYSISGSSSVSGTVVNLSGTATANPYTGKSSDQNIAVDWTGACDTSSKTVISFDSITFVGGNGNDQNGGSFTNATWSTSHDFGVAGSYSVCVKVYHANFNGAEGSDAATFSTTIVIPPPANNAPTANAQSITTNEDVATSSTLTGADADSDPITFGVVTGPANGSITAFNITTGAFTYTPNAGYFGADSFTFKTNDGTASSSAATVSITVVEVVTPPGNTAPIATPQAITTLQDTATSSTLAGTDADLDTLTFGTSTSPANGVITLFNALTGAFTYMPNSGYFGADSFTFVVNDGEATSSPATVSITVVSTSTVTACNDDIDNDEDGLTDFPADPGCSDANDNDETDQPVVTQQCNDGIDNDGDGDIDLADAGCSDANDNDESNDSSGGSSRHGGGSRSSSNSNTGGEVLGAQTAECVEYLLSYIKPGSNNDAVEVAKLQAFLNTFEGNALAVSGDYDSSTIAAVHAFQHKYAQDILTPWALKGSTGWVYYTTRKMVNTIFCKYEKEFPLTQAQLNDIAYVKARQGTFGTSGQATASSGTAATTVSATPAKTSAVGTVVLPSTTDQNAVGGSGDKTQTAATANASTTEQGWFTKFINWLFGK